MKRISEAQMTFPLSLFLPPGCRIDNCESCFSKDFCTKCKSGFYLHKGRCFDKCPEGFAPLEDTMECGGMSKRTKSGKNGNIKECSPFFIACLNRQIAKP